jgi:hypothetical protein
MHPYQLKHRKLFLSACRLALEVAQQHAFQHYRLASMHQVLRVLFVAWTCNSEPVDIAQALKEAADVLISREVPPAAAIEGWAEKMQAAAVAQAGPGVPSLPAGNSLRNWLLEVYPTRQPCVAINVGKHAAFLERLANYLLQLADAEVRADNCESAHGT